METTTPKNWLMHGMNSALGIEIDLKCTTIGFENQSPPVATVLSLEIDDHTLNRVCHVLGWATLKPNEE